MVIDFDQATCFQTNGANPWSTNVTVGTGSNRMLIVGISTKSNTRTIASAVYGAQNLILLRSDPNGTAGKTFILYLLNPASGTNTLTITFDTTAKGGMTVTSYTGVDQSDPIDTHNGGSGNSATASVTLTVITNNSWILQQVNADGNVTIAGWGAGQVQRCVGQTGGAPATRNAVGGNDEGPLSAGAQTQTATISATAQWATSAVAFKPYIGVPTGFNKLQYFTEPPTPGAFNKLKYASEPPVPSAWNKLAYEGE